QMGFYPALGVGRTCSGVKNKWPIARLRQQQFASALFQKSFLQRSWSYEIRRQLAHSLLGDVKMRINPMVYPHLHVAQQRMSELAADFVTPTPLQERFLKQCARELLLAQSSDWPFILHTGTSPAYAECRVKTHL